MKCLVVNQSLDLRILSALHSIFRISDHCRSLLCALHAQVASTQQFLIQNPSSTLSSSFCTSFFSSQEFQISIFINKDSIRSLIIFMISLLLLSFSASFFPSILYFIGCICYLSVVVNICLVNHCSWMINIFRGITLDCLTEIFL